MNNIIKKVYYCTCLFTWAIWGLGVIFTAIYRFGNQDNANHFFFNVVHPYNSIVLLFSVIPIIPIIGIAAIVHDFRSKSSTKKIILSVFALILTAILWLVYISLFVAWTGGV